MRRLPLIDALRLRGDAVAVSVSIDPAGTVVLLGKEETRVLATALLSALIDQ